MFLAWMPEVLPVAQAERTVLASKDQRKYRKGQGHSATPFICWHPSDPDLGT
jgi:hypothetical protein